MTLDISFLIDEFKRRVNEVSADMLPRLDVRLEDEFTLLEELILNYLVDKSKAMGAVFNIEPNQWLDRLMSNAMLRNTIDEMKVKF